MKKIPALVLALCLLCMSAAALAETAAEVTTLNLDGFSLELSNGEGYQQAEEKIQGQVYVVVLPFYANGDENTNYNAVWLGGSVELTAEDVYAEVASMEETMRSTLAASGVTLDSYQVGEAYEAELNGLSCIAVEMVMSVSYAGQSFTIYEREIVVGSLGYAFTVTASSEELMEEATQQMAMALNFD